METLTLKQNQRPLYQLQPQNSHPRLSLRRVIWVKILKSIDRASWHDIKKAFIRLLSVALLSVAVCTPTFLLGVATATWRVAGYPISVVVVSSFLVFYGLPLLRYMKKYRTKKRGANQHTFEGIPATELAQYLAREQSFKTDAIRTLGLSQGQYKKIAQKLEAAEILVRGEKNARVLNEITLEELVTQLRDGFPLVWSGYDKKWVPRRDSFAEYCLSRDFERRKLEEEGDKKKRKVARLNKQIAERKEHISALEGLFSPVSA